MPHEGGDGRESNGAKVNALKRFRAAVVSAAIINTILLGGNTTQKIDDDMRWLAREGAMAVTFVHRYLQELGD